MECWYIVWRSAVMSILLMANYCHSHSCLTIYRHFIINTTLFISLAYTLRKRKVINFHKVASKSLQSVFSVGLQTAYKLLGANEISAEISLPTVIASWLTTCSSLSSWEKAKSQVKPRQIAIKMDMKWIWSIFRRKKIK